jgi:hypothetical protein
VARCVQPYYLSSKMVNRELLPFRELINAFLKTVKPGVVEARRHHCFKRRRYWSAGVNDAWPQDQHDKWMHHGIFLHAGLDAYTGCINWMKAWWTNSNPQLITKYYIDCACREGGKLTYIVLSTNILTSICT